MGNKSITTRRYWRGLAEQWDGLPALATAYTSTEQFVRTASDNPKYKSSIKSGQNATNPMTVKASVVSFTRPKLKCQWISSQYSPQRYGKIIQTNILSNLSPGAHTELPSTNLQQSVYNSALIGIIKKIRKFETSSLSGPTFVGELRETVAMIRSPLKSLRLKTGLFTDLHMRILRDKQAKGKRFKPESWSKVLSDTWLEWSFGAAPAISDIAAIADMYLNAKDAAYSNGLKRLSYRFSDSYNEQYAMNPNPAWQGTGISVPATMVKHFRSSAQFVVWIDQSLLFADGPMDRLRDASKFRLDEILPTAWELMPWSFLIDYFTNIGDVLGCTFDYDRNVAFGKLTTVDTGTYFHVPGIPKSVEPILYVPFEFEPWTYTSTYTRVVRSQTAGLGFPNTSVSLPSLGQTFNIAALMSSLRDNNPFRGHTLK